MPKIAETAKLAAWVTIAVIAVNFILSKIGIAVTQLYSIQGVTGLSGTPSTKLISIINGLGFVNLDISILWLFLSTALVIYVGSLLYGKIKIPSTSKNWTRLTAVLFYGTVLMYLILVGFTPVSPTAVIAPLAIYYGVISFSAYMLQNLASKIRV